MVVVEYFSDFIQKIYTNITLSCLLYFQRNALGTDLMAFNDHRLIYNSRFTNFFK